MRRNRKLFGIFLVITALIIMQLPRSEADAAASASDFKIEGTTLVKYQGKDKNVTVPNTVEEIGKGAFEENDTIERVVLPDSVKKINTYAFWGCDNLNTVVLGKGLTEVGDFVFTSCKGLERMTIPENIRSIGIQAFADCVNMTDITIPAQVVNIHDTAFDGCYRLVIHCETGTVADKYAQAFYEKQQEMPEYEDVDAYQPDDTSNTGDDNTGNNNGTDSSNGNVTVPDVPGNVLGSTMVVGNQAVFFIDSASPVVQSGMPVPANEGISEDMPFVDGSTFPKYTIVDGRKVADQAYYRNNSLTNVTLPAGITEVGQFAYARSSLTGIVLPEGVERISYGAFYHCDNLSSVELPSTISVVEPKAFTHTAWVENFLGGNGTDGEDDFLVSGNTLAAYRGRKSQVEIPEGVTVIAGEAFKGHTEIESVSLPDSMRVIGEGAFEDCSNLSILHLNSQASADQGITDIKDRAFAGCALEQVILPVSVERMGLKAFDDGVIIDYQGGTPDTVHEISAERLSNEDYRVPGAENAAPGVTVEGMENAMAQLEGANRHYTLTVREVSGDASMEQAFIRNGRMAMPQDIRLYDLTLSDNSGIPLSKLGKQMLTVTMPVPADLSGQGIQAVTLDRSGQLEQLEAERVRVNGVDCIRFRTNHLTLFGMYGDGTAVNSDEIMEETTMTGTVTLSSMSGAPETAGISEGGFQGGFRYQWILGSVLLISGVMCIFTKKIFTPL